jgi:hypothetical protein
MRLDNKQVSANILNSGDNLIMCSCLQEAFFDIYSVEIQGESFLKKADRIIDGCPIIKLNVEHQGIEYRDVEFKLVAADADEVFINETLLQHGFEYAAPVQSFCIEQQLCEIAQEPQYIEYTPETMEIMAVPDASVLKEQARNSQEKRIKKTLSNIYNKLNDHLSEQLQQAKTSMLQETLQSQMQMQQQSKQKLDASVVDLQQEFNDLSQQFQKVSRRFTDDAVAKFKSTVVEQCNAVLYENNAVQLEQLQLQIKQNAVDAKDALQQNLKKSFKEKFQQLSAQHTEHEQQVQVFVEQQLQSMQQQIKLQQIKTFEDSVAALMNDQSMFIDGVVNNKITFIQESLQSLSQQLQQTLLQQMQNSHSETQQHLLQMSEQVDGKLSTVDNLVSSAVADASQQLTQHVDSLNASRLATVEQQVEQILREQFSQAASQDTVVEEASQNRAISNAINAFKSQLNKDLQTQAANLQTEMYRKFAIYADSMGGGGSVAAQYADGGTMNGSLNVNGQILSGGVDISTLFGGGGGGGSGLTIFSEVSSTASPNNITPTFGLSARSLSANVDFAIIPKGEGALLAQIPDGSYIGGNKRGANATDWQRFRNDAFQVASGQSSTIGGGVSNNASGINSTIAGGNGNTASVDATVGGGTANSAAGQSSTVGGGNNNNASNEAATIGGGSTNTASGLYTTIAGGNVNNALNEGDTIGGGSNNIATGGYSTIGGGQGLSATGGNSTVGGGQTNIASEGHSTIAGGVGNSASGQSSTIGGGDSNITSGSNSTIGGGQSNVASGPSSTIGGGVDNNASGADSFIAGGVSNDTNNQYNTFILGSNITASLSNFTYVNNLSSQGDIRASSTIYSLSGNSNQWNSTYSTVQTSSASWGTGGSTIDTGVRALTSNWQSTYTTVNSQSANWQNTYTAFSTQSANNESVYSTVQEYSAGWGTGGGGSGAYLPLSGGTLTGTLSVGTGGVVSILSNNKLAFTNSDIPGSNTSLNYGTLTLEDVPAENGYRNGVRAVLNSDNSYIRVTNTGSADYRLTTYGLQFITESWSSLLQPNSYQVGDAPIFNLPADRFGGTLLTETGDSANKWNSTYTTVRTNSASWGGGGGGGGGIDTGIRALTSNWQSTYTTVSSQSANWQNTYTAFRSQSANNLSVYSTVNTNSATNWNYQGTDIKALTATWQNTFTDFSIQSANNLSVYSNVNSNSASWGTGGTAQTLSFNETNSDLTLSLGNTVSLSALASFISTFTTNGTWINPYPNDARPVTITLIGGGGGGGSGRNSVDTTTSKGGGGGGAGAGLIIFNTYTNMLSATESIIVGAGGTGGARQPLSGVGGFNGLIGNATTMTLSGATLRAIGGNGGSNGTTGVAGGGTAVNFSTVCFNAALTNANGGAGSTGSANAVAGGALNYFAPTGGGGGGGSSIANALFNAAAGGSFLTASIIIAGAAVGVGAGASGSIGYSYLGVGAGGAGGNASNVPGVSGGNGGNGGFPGGGGGGGGGYGASSLAAQSGAGGNGGNGVVKIIVY